jgi:membrane-associated protein
VTELLDSILHVDTYLLQLVAMYGAWIYAILFVVVFAETGFVVTPFLPGDSLLFAAGAIAAAGALDVWLLGLLLAAAAILGNTVNYSVGRFAGEQILERARVHPQLGRVIRPSYVARAHEFFERHGGKAVVLGRFVPIVRTFVPFVAGVASMSYATYMFYNVVGSVAWVGLCVAAGWVFGNVPIVKDNFSLAAIGIVIVSLLPMAFEYLRYRRAAPKT